VSDDPAGLPEEAGPRLLLSTTWWPWATAWRAMARATVPAPRVPIFMAVSFVGFRVRGW